MQPLNKNYGSGTTKLIISNEEMEEFDLLIKDVSKAK